ncbi:dihydroxyacetone kinase phosphoryl donor subunit DhaM [Virgibacillus halophilus]|uniref:phosphoenolpyruvate--glycerone phosphotransferase n=1 Tax=Tigheibacillus halophilus TaxID=361280 RepID=A0ABU5C412_9BACI|nr:dihydroxyacetone kinase phosphoryl donor subunit DhaM [Virgibacillus halophilus]
MAKVGIVLVSHSPKIAAGLQELIGQVITDIPVETAGGTEDNGIGTSIDKIMAAMKKADEGAGVLVFYDLGSAKMNAEMAVEMMETEQIIVMETPLVESAYVAAVESNMGKSLEEVQKTVEKDF